MQRGFLQATTIALVSLGAVVLRGADAGVRPESSFVRPREHVRGFDLDEAWRRYDATVATESTKFVDVLNGLIDKAKQKQDAAELTTWSDVLDEFREEGVFPSIKMIKEQVGEAKASLARAGQQLLEKGYERALEEASGKPQPNRAEIDALRGEMVIVKNNPLEGPKIFLRDLQEEELVFVPPFVGGQPFQKNDFFHVGGQVRPRSILGRKSRSSTCCCRTLPARSRFRSKSGKTRSAATRCGAHHLSGVEPLAGGWPGGIS